MNFPLDAAPLQRGIFLRSEDETDRAGIPKKQAIQRCSIFSVAQGDNARQTCSGGTGAIAGSNGDNHPTTTASPSQRIRCITKWNTQALPQGITQMRPFPPSHPTHSSPSNSRVLVVLALIDCSASVRQNSAFPGPHSSSRNEPPCATITRLDNASPSPVPCSLPSLPNGWNSISRTASATPGPLSPTRMDTQSSAPDTVTSTLPRPYLAWPPGNHATAHCRSRDQAPAASRWRSHLCRHYALRDASRPAPQHDQ